jgi:uncharacterized secreted repeat protein (TIGR03808 family)
LHVAIRHREYASIQVGKLFREQRIVSRAGLTRRATLGALLAPGLALNWPARAQMLFGDMRGSLDAAQEGLRPGAVDDQSAALMSALVKAEAGGQALFLPPGRYRIGEVALPGRTQLVGVPGQTRLEFSGGGFMLRARHSASFRMAGVTLDGAGLSFADGHHGLLEAEGVTEIVIGECAFAGSAGAGILLRDCAGRVERSNVSGAATIGIDVVQSRGMAITDNVIGDCGETGILVERYEEGADDTIVRGNRVRAIRADPGGTGQYGNGINVSKANGVTVAQNRIDNCDFSAIRCFSSDNVQLLGNLATRSGEMAIYVEFAFEGAVVSDNLVDGAAFGISLANFAEHGGRLAVVSGNLVRNISGVSRLPRGAPIVGTGIAVEADVAVTGNVVENAANGLALGWGPYLRDVSATGNVIRGVERGIVVTVVEGAGPALIANNLISGAIDAAIIGMRWDEVATGDLALAGAEAYPQLTISGNNVS